MPGTVGGKSLDAAKIDAAYVGYFTTFHDRLQKVGAAYERISTVVDTEDEVDMQIWLSSNPTMRKWVGPKELIKYRGESHRIKTEPYEASVEVPKRDVLNDRLGLYKRRIASLADSYAYAIDDLVVDMLVAGVAGTSLGTTYDGQNLIDTDHVFLSADAGVVAKQQSNKVTGVLSETVYQTAWERYGLFVDEFGNPIRVTPSFLLVGPKNRVVARKILEQDIKASGERNIERGTVGLIVHPRITGTEWFLMPEGSSAVVVHRKRGPEFLSVDDPNDSFVFRTGKFLYGTEAEFGAAYGMWQEVVAGPGA